MKLEGYKSGMYTRVEDYRAFILSKINYNWSWEDAKINKLLEEASYKLGELNSYSLLFPDIDIYIKMNIKVEAINSSKIDKKEVSIEEIFGESKELEDKKTTIKEVQNCEEGIKYGIEKVKETQKINTKVLSEIHGVLMQELGKEENL